jgi:hypothetical protein
VRQAIYKAKQDEIVLNFNCGILKHICYSFVKALGQPNQKNLAFEPCVFPKKCIILLQQLEANYKTIE